MNTEISVLLERAHSSFSLWSLTSFKQRKELLIQMRESILNQLDEWLDLIHEETGKHRFEALSQEILPALQWLTHYAENGPSLLKEKKMKHVWLKHHKTIECYVPMGVVLVITPRNYPFFTAIRDISLSLLGGNAVLFKPSEHTPKIAKSIFELMGEAGLPGDVLQLLPLEQRSVERVLELRINKLIFTGKTETARKILPLTQAHFTPFCMSLSGESIALVLPDATLDYCASLLYWANQHTQNSSCLNIKKVFVHSKIEAQLKKALNELINEDCMNGFEFITYHSVSEAITQINKIEALLQVTILTKNGNSGAAFAHSIQCASILVNDFAANAILPEIRWNSWAPAGYGENTPSDRIFEVVRTKHIQVPTSRLFTMKAPWWFPYTEEKMILFRKVAELYRRSAIDKLQNFPFLLWHFVDFIKKNKS